VALIFIVLALLYSLYAGAQALRKHDTPYRIRQGFESIAPCILWPLVGLGVLASLPYIHGLIGQEVGKEGVAGAVMTIGGAAMGLWARFVPKGAAAGKAMAWLGPIGASLLLYGIGLMGYALSVHWFPHDRLIFTDPARLVWPIIVLLAFLVLGYLARLHQ